MHRDHPHQSRSEPHGWQAWTTRVVFERQPGDLTRTANLIILKIGPKESPSRSGYTTSIRRCPMPQTELTSANRVAFLEHLSASIPQINHPISALLKPPHPSLTLLLAHPPHP